ncbi:hypothetical protein Tco_0131427, partial [Tanacetum coccineum]
MSDSEDSTVTYTVVSSPFEDRLDIGSPGVDGPPIMPEDPYAFIILPAEEQPLPTTASPTADSPGYVPESDPEEDDEDPKEDPANYPADRDDDNEEKEEEPSRDDANDEDEDEEEEHPAPADSVPPVHRMTARI